MTITLRTGITMLDTFFGALALLLIYRLIARLRSNPIPKGLKLPPGPPGKLIFGNASDMPTRLEWKTFSQWAKDYGDLVSLNVFGTSMIVVNSQDVAFDLFEKRSSIYSDRGDFPMINDLIGWEWAVAFMPYGERWRRHRRHIHQKFHPTAATEYHSIQTKHARALLRRFHESPDDFVQHLRHTAGAIIMEVVYGIKVLPKDDPYIETAEKALAGLSVAGNPGAFLVDMLPILKHVPEWFPGAGFRKKARIWRESTTQMSVVPFAAVKNALNTGTAQSCVTTSWLEALSYQADSSPDAEDTIRGAGSTCYAAGADTTVSALHTFMLAMLLYPDVQKKAQAELDNVLGPDRLPEFDDRESLPYVNAICKETHRWQPVLPLGIAHRVMQDNIYGNYFIPKGSLVIGNAWHILHDEATYGPETDKFKPERFLVPGVRDPTAAFGFGRRLCPGRYLADNSVFSAVASILKVFNITPALDSNGKEISVNSAFTSGFMSHPEAFLCCIRPRSDTAERLLERIDD